MVKNEDLIRACKKHVMADSETVVVREPYIPYIPNNWNQVLVLAESQNLSSSNDGYVQYLNSLAATKRMNRLGLEADTIGIQPWDDGSLKLAVEAAFDIVAKETAVSNAVLWSQRGSSKQNINPDNDLQSRSSELWSEMLKLLNPRLVICSGNIANSVITNTRWSGNIIKLRLPSKTAMSRVSGMFDENDLLRRYPEVDTVLNLHPEWASGGYRKNKIFFACHAVSLNKYENTSCMKSRMPTSKEIEALISFLPKLYADGFAPIKEWNGGTKGRDGVIAMPWPEYNEIVEAFYQVASNEYWSDYDYSPEEAGRMLEDAKMTKNANLAQIKNMLTYCVRGEHFCDGHWGAMIEGGQIRRLLLRLTEIGSKNR